MMGLFCGSHICDYTYKNYLETLSIVYDKHPCATHIVEESRFVEYIRDMIYSQRILFWVFLLKAILLFSTSYAQTTLTPLCQYQAPPGADYINQIHFPYESQPAKRGSDANHDGYDDFIKAYGYTNISGVDVVCFWGSSVLSNSPNCIYNWPSTGISGACVTWHGDLNGDGLNDFVATYQGYVGMYAVISFSDSPFNINPDLTFQLPYWGGFSALNGGYDFNSDGYDDILCVDEDNGYWEGNVDIIFGGNPMDTAVDVHIQGSDPDGVRVGEQYAVGDINGDSIDDLILSRQGLGDYAPLYLDIYYGGSAFINPKVSISLSLPHPFMWESDLLANGDINGDGYDDICIPYNDSLYVFWGIEGLITDYSTFYIENSQPQPMKTNAFYCNINNDEYDDLGIRMWGENHVDFYLGGENLQTQPAYSIAITPCLSSGGIGVDLGDINGDQHDDVLVSDGGTFNTATVYSLNPVATVDPVMPAGEWIHNYPNPFKHSTTFSYNVRDHNMMEFRIEIFNIKGQKIRDLFVNSSLTTSWDGRDSKNHLVSSGLYYYRLLGPRYSSKIMKMILINQ
jgi:hypothetical protein